MLVHQVIDALTGRDDGLNLAVPNVPLERKMPFVGWMAEVAGRIAGAQHFEFENVPVAPDGNGAFDLPGVDEEERRFFAEGLIPMPFPACWFEVPVPPGEHGGEVLCYLLEEHADRSAIDVTPFRMIRLPEGRAVQVTGASWRIVRHPEDGVPKIDVFDSFGGMRVMEEMYAAMGVRTDASQSVRGEVGLITYLLLMLVSRSTETREVPAPDRLNRARARKGRAPLPAHRVVSVVPSRVARAVREEEGAVGTGSGVVRASPRMHWRRSHLRTLPSGEVTVVARALVGYRAADGRELVTHDYRVVL